MSCNPKFKSIIYEKENGIATITLNRPHKLNALSIDTYSEIDQALDLAEADSKVRVLVITGSGDRAFCAGNDVGEFKKMDTTTTRASLKKNMALILKLQKLDKPIIAAVNGLALGGGFELALCCDLTVASEKATFCLPEPRVGLSLGPAVPAYQRKGSATLW